MLLTPAHQFPLGVALAPAAPPAGRPGCPAGAVIIEDDYDGEFRYDRQPVGALQALAPDQSSTPARPARAWPPACGWAGSSCPPRLLDDVVAAELAAGPAAASTS